MKTLASAASVLLLLGAGASAQTLDDLKNDGKNTDNVLTYGMGYHQQRYSPLKQINKQNVKRLVPVWNLSLDNNWGEQAQPLVYNGVMYVTNARATVAIDVRDRQADLAHADRVAAGDAARRVLRRLEQGRRDLRRQGLPHHARRACASRSTRRPARRSGRRRSPSGRKAIRMTLAPLIANGVLITGISGAEFGVRGFIDGWDPETGKQLWRRYTIPARGEKGNETWPQDDDAWELGGGSSLDHRLLRSRARSHVLGHRQSGAVGVADAAPATTSTRRRCWRCGRRPARSSGTTSSRPTTRTTTTPTGS